MNVSAAKVVFTAVGRASALEAGALLEWASGPERLVNWLLMDGGNLYSVVWQWNIDVAAIQVENLHSLEHVLDELHGPILAHGLLDDSDKAGVAVCMLALLLWSSPSSSSSLLILAKP